MSKFNKLTLQTPVPSDIAISQVKKRRVCVWVCACVGLCVCVCKCVCVSVCIRLLIYTCAYVCAVCCTLHACDLVHMCALQYLPPPPFNSP
jgi:hypothetical protein